jgi:hypothetical protein
MRSPTKTLSLISGGENVVATTKPTTSQTCFQPLSREVYTALPVRS